MLCLGSDLDWCVFRVSGWVRFLEFTVFMLLYIVLCLVHMLCIKNVPDFIIGLFNSSI